MLILMEKVSITALVCIVNTTPLAEGRSIKLVSVAGWGEQGSSSGGKTVAIGCLIEVNHRNRRLIDGWRHIWDGS